MSSEKQANENRDAIHHVAVSVSDIPAAVEWYCTNFKCSVDYQDNTWAMLQFANIKLALVIPEEHPPHVGFATSRASEFGELRTHRDGTRSIYISDVAGNAIELLDPESISDE